MDGGALAAGRAWPRVDLAATAPWLCDPGFPRVCSGQQWLHRIGHTRVCQNIEQLSDQQHEPSYDVANTLLLNML